MTTEKKKVLTLEEVKEQGLEYRVEKSGVYWYKTEDGKWRVEKVELGDINILNPIDNAAETNDNLQGIYQSEIYQKIGKFLWNAYLGDRLTTPIQDIYSQLEQVLLDAIEQEVRYTILQSPYVQQITSYEQTLNPETRGLVINFSYI